MKLPFVENIICRDGDRVLVCVKHSVIIDNQSVFKNRFEVWNDIAKYHFGIASEMQNNAYYVHMFVIDAQNESAAKQIFYALK